MNRKILFRAKRKDNGEWVEGDLEHTKYDDVIWIVDVRGEKCYRCDSDTICQYTGLTDENGRKIWENDIIKCLKRKEGYDIYKVVWRKWYADFGVEPIKPKYEAQYPIGLSDGATLHGRDYKVIGNIFDNPELLEVE